MITNLFKSLLITFTVLMAINCSSNSDTTSTPVDTCQLIEITTVDGSTKYTYNSDKKWENITVTDSDGATTYWLTYVKTKPNGPVLFIENIANSSLSIFNYDENDYLVNVITTIKKLDMGKILGSEAVGTNFTTELKFEWNSDNQLVKRTHETTVDVTIGNITEPFTISGYETYEYDVSDRLVKTNNYTNEEITVNGNVVVEAGLVGFSIIEYDGITTNFIQSMGLKNLAFDIGTDGQVLIEPKTGPFPVAKFTYYLDDGNGSVTPYVTNYEHANNASGYLSSTEIDSELITYIYKNCK